jgi:hypothetical protein
MATGTQTQTAWALWIRDLAEMLETHVTEVKHQGDPKPQHPEPLVHGRLLHATIYWKSSQSTVHWASAVQDCQPAASQPTGPWPCQASTPQAVQAHAPQARWAPSPPGCHPKDPSGHCQSARQATARTECSPLAHLPTRPPPCRPTTCNRTLALTLPRRQRQTGIYAKGVTPEQLRL